MGIVGEFKAVWYDLRDLRARFHASDESVRNLVSQVATYCLFGGLHYFFITNGNQVVFGNGTVEGKRMTILLSKTFDNTKQEGQYSFLERFVRFIVATAKDAFQLREENVPELLKVYVSQNGCSITVKELLDNLIQAARQEHQEKIDDLGGSGFDESPVEVSGAASSHGNQDSCGNAVDTLEKLLLVQTKKRMQADFGSLQEPVHKNPRREDDYLYTIPNGDDYLDNGNDVCEEWSGYKIAPLCYADLFSLRFVTPPRLSPRDQWSSSKVEGDAPVIGYGRSGQVHLLKDVKGLKGGESYDVAVKVCLWGWIHGRDDQEPDPSPSDLKREMEQEFLAYWYLTDLQGDVIPRLLWFGEILVGAGTALATEYGGQALSEEEITPQLRDDMIAALAKVHEKGVLHGDIKVENFIKDEQGRVRIIDFAFAKFRGDLPFGNVRGDVVSQARWQQATEKELAMVSRL